MVCDKLNSFLFLLAIPLLPIPPSVEDLTLFISGSSGFFVNFFAAAGLEDMVLLLLEESDRSLLTSVKTLLLAGDEGVLNTGGVPFCEESELSIVTVVFSKALVGLLMVLDDVFS